ncbi:hypothetical protein FJ659_21610 [Bacillus dicomae]|uniref:Uncharacterized protein n=1 Tax=Bacillus dicomae TaxID=3088378 RepID=A0AC61T1I2_9BACI|nr:hypothetical protein FJ659_21610 [Bacillus dicomae]
MVSNLFLYLFFRESEEVRWRMNKTPLIKVSLYLFCGMVFFECFLFKTFFKYLSNMHYCINKLKFIS